MPRLRMSLWVAIGAPFFALLFLTATLQVQHQADETRRELDLASQHVLDALGTNTRNSLQEFLGEPFRIQRSIGDAIGRHGLYTRSNIGTVTEYILGQYQDLYREQRHISVMSFGSESGDYGGIRREDTAPGTPDRFNLMRKDRTTGNVLRIFDGPSLRTPLRARFDAYDPRHRPWYRPAADSGRALWSAIYANYDEQAEITISATSPVRRNGHLIGVVEADVKLDGINRFLREEPLLRNGVVAIVDPEGRLVAHSLPGSVVADGSGRSARAQRMLIDESPSAVLRATAPWVMGEQALREVSFSVRQDGSRYFGRVTPYDDPAGIHWRIVSLMPESDLLGDAPTGRGFNAVSLLLATLGAVCGVLLVRIISRPLEGVAKAANALSLGDVQAVLPEDGLLEETNDLARAFNSMARRLQDSFTELRDQKRRLDRSVQENRALLLAVPEYMTISLLETGELLEVNPGFEELTGWSREEAIGRTTPELGILSVAERARITSALRAQGGQVRGLSTQLCHRDGHTFDVLASLAIYEVGWRQYLVAIARDMTEANQREAALRATDQRLSDLIQTVQGIVWEADATTFTFTFISQQAERMLGFATSDWLTPGFWVEHLHPDDRSWAPSFCASCTGRLEAHDFEYRFIAKDGRTVWLHDIVTVVSENGQPRWLRGLMVDITTQKVQQQALSDSQARWAQMFAALPDYACITRVTDGEIIDVNPSFERITGWQRDEAIGRTTLALGIWTNLQDRERYLDQLQRQSVLHDFEGLLTTRSGEKRIMIISAAIVHSGDGDLLISIARDATQQRQQEIAIRHSNAMHQALFHAMPEYVAISELATGKLLEVSRGFEVMSGWTRRAALGRTSIELGIISAEFRETIKRELRAANGQVQRLEGHIRRKDGVVLDAVASFAAYEVDGQQYLATIASDVTDERRREAELRDSQSRWAQMFTALPYYACITRMVDATIIDINPSFERITGWSRDQVIGKTAVGLGIWAEPGDQKRFLTLLHQHTVLNDFEATLTTRSGEKRTMIIFAAIARASGGDILLSVARDATDERRRETELRDTQAAKQAAEVANQLKSDFLAMISHEVRTPLGGVIGMLRFALKDATLSTGTQEKLSIGLSNAETLLQIINDILDFSKLQAGKMPLEEVDFRLATVVRDAVTILQERAESKGLSLVAEVAADLPIWCLGDPTRLRQVLINLMGNAIKFTQHGEVRLSVRVHHSGGLEFAVRDTGIGIAPDAQQRLFRKFEQADASTARRFGGTGLGLAICKSIVESMGGDITVTSTPGQGSTFSVYLPLPEGQPVRETAPDSAQAHGRSLRVLCAEDGVTNQVILRELVTSMGHSFTLAEDGEAALEALAANDFDLLILDSRMPRMDGIDVLRSLRAGERGVRNPLLPVIACTANAGADERARFLAAGAQGFVSKPIDESALHAAIAETLGESPPLPAVPIPARPAMATAMTATPAMCLAFTTEGPRLVSALRQALQDADIATAARAAHGLKGSAGYFGATQLQVLAQTAERHANAEQLSAVAALMERIDAAMEQLVAQLRKRTAPVVTTSPAEPSGHDAATVFDRSLCLASLDHLKGLLDAQSLEAEPALAHLLTLLPTGDARDAALQLGRYLADFDFSLAQEHLRILCDLVENLPHAPSH
ncbi:PAS domain S-box protein [Curvibacter sp. APW13]|uniref:PAS domain S-box protein n=1 Tax=Curvibacter sp. APW13 TaxID=3077236 RepID=UPI0028DE65AA|nr:PAS domain S-box protein [Curvibacter sp. APW13]MDT8989410.1 PAS domain S-box protein [Curvibacter sp. APW13]